MKRKFFSMLLMGAMTIASVGMFTSCKDYDDDINNLQKQIDANKSDLQTQLTTLQSALTAAQGAAAAAQQTADKAVQDAKNAAAAAQAAADAASAADAKAVAAAAAAQAAQATADLCAKQETVAALESAINDLKTIIAGKVDQDAFDAAIASVEAKIAAIDEKLLTLDDVKKLLDEAGFATQAALNDVQGQIDALNEFKKTLEALSPIGDQAWKDAVDAAIASLEEIKTDIAAKASQADVDGLKEQMQKAEAAITALNDLKIEEKLAAIGASIDMLNIYLKRDLKSLVLRPSTYYGGIEGVSVYTYEFPKEVNNPCHANLMYRYFERNGDLNISDYGVAEYHVNPSNVDLTKFSIDFYNHNADLMQPAAGEKAVTRGGDASGITPIYKTTEDLFAAYDKDENKSLKKLWNDERIISIPFSADAKAIEANLQKSIGTIASLSMTKIGAEGVADTTVNSDYALIVPTYGYGLLIGDNMFEPTTPNVYEDIIGLDRGDVNSANLHRNFSFLALAATSPTHEIKYDGKFNISKVLESRVVLKKADWEAIKDTAGLHPNHKETAKWDLVTLNPEDDSDASIDANKVKTLSAADMERLGLTYDIQLVNYVLGTNKTGETVHLQLETDANGDVWARPCNVTADGKTIPSSEESPANAACVGRQPIVCIMVRDKNNNIVSFAYMKFLITPDVPEDPIDKAINFDIKDIWVNCEPADGRVTWSEIEYHLLDQALGGMSKADFDLNYVFDYYDWDVIDDEKDATFHIYTRYGIQYDKNGKRINTADEFGTVAEQWNVSSQGVEDATTHIIKWSFTAQQLADRAKALKDAGGLEDKGDYYVNKEPIETWVRYAHKIYTPITDAPAVGEAPVNGKPSIWVKLTIKAGELHVAKGDMGANKILTYWYDLNSKTNATSTKDAYEVRVNVPVPVPEASATEKTIGYDYPANAEKLDIRYDNLLEGWEDDLNAKTDPAPKRANNKFSEFTKNLKDYFIKGELTATVKEAGHFGSIKNMKLGCEFITPSKALGNAKGFEADAKGNWTVNGYTGAVYTLQLNADHTKIQIIKKNNDAFPEPIDLVTLNYDDNATPEDRQITVLNYVNGENQDDILNYKTHNELGERETFTAYINIKAVNACAPVYWDNMWFNVRFLRPLDLENPKQGLVPDAPNDWHTVDLTDALIVKDWREYYGDRQNRTGGKDVSLVLPSVGNQKAFDYAYYQVELDITENVYYTDANLGTNERSDIFTLGHMPVIENVDDAKARKFILTSDVPNLKLEKTGKTTLRYLNNSGVTGGFHVFVPITMTYIYGWQTVRQTKWVTIGVTPSVEQAMFE